MDQQQGSLAHKRPRWSATRWVCWICLPIVFVAISAVAFCELNPPADVVWHKAGRWMLNFILIFLPGAIFALFIVARSNSLLNSFIANLDRLGLLGWRCLIGHESVQYVPNPKEVSRGRSARIETAESRKRRIGSYFDRFQAIYGNVAPGVLESVIKENPGQPVPHIQASVSPSLLRTYFVPVYVVTILCAIGWFASLPPLTINEVPTTTLASLVPHVTAVSAAFFGAYLFSLQLLVWRFMRRDLGPNAYVAFNQRMVLAVIAAWMLPFILDVSPVSLTGDYKEKWILVLAFVIGAFPMILWQLIGGAVKKLPGVSLALPNLRTELPLSDLDGLTVWHEARLQEEDVENVHNMATADVVDLVLSTRFPPHRIIEWIDQSILLSCVAGEDREVTTLRRNELRKHGITNATSLLVAMCEKHISNDAEIKITANDNIKLLPWLVVLADGICTRCNLSLVRAWKNIDADVPKLASTDVAKLESRNAPVIAPQRRNGGDTPALGPVEHGQQPNEIRAGFVEGLCETQRHCER